MRKPAFWLTILLAILCLSIGAAAAQGGVTILVNRDAVNVRLFPAIGAADLGFVNAGWTATATGRSPDNEWVRIDFNGEEGWIGTAVINIFGDINSLPVADPRTIPYGGFDSPRSGTTSATSPVTGKLVQSGLHVRAGPSRAYPVLADAPRNTILPILGRTPNNAWLQVNYEGTLGWVATQYVEFETGSILDLPVDGIVADSLPISEPTRANYISVLKLMLSRIDISQAALDSIRSTWTNVALGQRIACGYYPSAPTDIQVANELLAAFYPTLNPLVTDFNTAMGDVSQAINLLVDTCSRPQPEQGAVGQAVVQGALNYVNQADTLFADLRARLLALIPPERVPGPNECLFSFQENSDILPIITIGQVAYDELDPRRFVIGFCLDVDAGRTLRFEILTISGNLEEQVSVSPIDNPTNFIAVGNATPGESLLTIIPVLITTSGRYLLVISDLGGPGRNEPINGNIAILVTDITGVTGSLTPGLTLDPTTGQVIVNPVATPGPGFTPVATTAANACPSLAFTCTQLTTCQQARACLAAGNFSLDPNNNGVPCEENNLCP